MRVLPVCILVVVVNAALAGENGGKNPKVLPELAPDPKVTAILEKLGDNEYAQLPPAKITGEFNALAKRFRLHERGPGQRDYCLKMPWSPDRKRAFYAGGNHGAPHKLNDLWEYDLPSNTWVLLSPPDFDASNRKAYMDQVVFKDGVVKTRSGKLLVGGHTFSGFTYDPELRLLLWYHKRVSPSRYFPDNPEYEKAYFSGPYLWGFDPYARKWQHIKTKPPFGRYDPGSAFVYDPKLKKSLWINNREGSGMWSYEHANRNWKKMTAKGGDGQATKMSAQIVYDSRRDILIGHGGHSNYTSEFGFANMSWKKTVTVDKQNKVAPGGGGQAQHLRLRRGQRRGAALRQPSGLCLGLRPRRPQVDADDPQELQARRPAQVRHQEGQEVHAPGVLRPVAQCPGAERGRQDRVGLPVQAGQGGQEAVGNAARRPGASCMPGGARRESGAGQYGGNRP